MASISQGLVFTTAMVLSSTVLYLAFSRQKINPPFNIQIHGDSDSRESNKQKLRSCLSSDEKKKERKMSKKKKRVQFAENVKEGGIEKSDEEEEELIREEQQRKQNRVSIICRHENREIRGMPANRIALYNGILRDRTHKMECSY